MKVYIVVALTYIDYQKAIEFIDEVYKTEEAAIKKMKALMNEKKKGYEYQIIEKPLLD